jgi:hypothetical protein
MGMGYETVLEILLVWFIIGVVIGGWISIDTFRRKVEGARWIAAGIFLSVIGLALYLFMHRRAKAVKPSEFRPAPEEYRYAEPASPEVRPAPEAKAVAEPAPATPEPARPGQEPQRDGAETPQAEERSQYNSWAPVIREQIEGIPRCQKCGTAASGFDVFCSVCGAKIK